MGIRIQNYHAVNGQFANNAFLKDVQSKGQGISFCDFGAHFQNGIAEKKIQDLQESTLTMLINAQN